MQSNFIKSDIEESLSRLSGRTPHAIGAALASRDCGVVMLRRVRGKYFEAIRIPGSWVYDPWDIAAKNSKSFKRMFAEVEADAVGVQLPNGQRFVVDPESLRLTRFAELIDGRVY